MKNPPITRTQAYLKKLFSAYYRSKAKNFPQTRSLPQREFAFLSWDHPGMIRHLAYPDQDFLIQHLINQAPRHSYHSATYYNYPGADKMEDKGYLGCDFVTDIDADHIPTTCRLDHNYFICKNCGTQYKGEKPEKCECEGTKFDKILWLCDECLDVSKQQVSNLVDNFLIPNFGLNLEDINLNFSGHRGYHIHLNGEAWRGLDQDARREIADYVTGEGISLKYWNYKKTQNVMQGFSIDQTGWSGLIANEFLRVLKRGEEYVKNYFHNPIYGKALTKSIIDQLSLNRQQLVMNLEAKSKIWDVPSVGFASWERIFHILKDHVKADIDVVVSIDLHRLIRLDGSLHGKAGFKVMEVEFDNLKTFDPLMDALAFPSSDQNNLSLIITAPVAPKIRIGNQIFGPYIQGEKINLPLNAAVFLLCKDVAQLIKN